MGPHRRTLADAAVVLLVSLSAFAQTPTFRAGVDVATVDVSVSRGGEHVEGLKVENFAVFDNDVKQKIDKVTIEQVPLEAYLVLDMSGSVEGARLEQLERAASAFVDGLTPQDTLRRDSRGPHQRRAKWEPTAC